jgi:hypothetical protein
MRRFTLFVVLVAFTFSSGAQWPVLQCVAWANMIREYSEMVPLGQAVKMTFSGQYPCDLCKAITEKKQEENAKFVSSLKHEKKMVTLGLEVKTVSITITPQVFVTPSPLFRTRSDSPPTPPPRLA